MFTTLIRTLGVRGVAVEEVYDIHPGALERPAPLGLVLCFTCQNEDDDSHGRSRKTHRAGVSTRDAAEAIWFANQLVDDACASLAILNVLFNCPGVELGDELEAFKVETAEMSPKVRHSLSDARLLGFEF